MCSMGIPIMPKSKSSQQWLGRHFKDPYVKQAQKEGYRSRAAYKLLEIHQKTPILKKGMCVVELGAAPGGWSQVVKEIIGHQGLLVAVDLLPMNSIPGVECIQGDFTESTILERIWERLAGKQVDLVLSDMLPNTSGITDVDQEKSITLVSLALEFAERILKKGGVFLCKFLQGRGFEEMMQDIQKQFKKVKICKPAASRKHSREVYILGEGYMGISD